MRNNELKLMTYGHWEHKEYYLKESFCYWKRTKRNQCEIWAFGSHRPWLPNHDQYKV